MKPPESDRSRFDDSQPEGPVFSLGDLFSVETFYQETDEEKRFNLLQTLPVPMLKLLITASLLDTGSYEVIQKLAKLNSTEVFLEALSRALTVRYVIQVPGGHQGELRYKVDPELKAFINGPMQLRHDLESNYRRLQLPSYQEFLGADLAQQEAIWMSFPQELQKRLLVDGFAVGAVDGGFGPKTDSALKAFQTAHGVSPTGATDEITWMWLNDWPRPPSQTVGKHILIDDLVKRLWIVDEKGQTRYTGGITNNSQALATVPFDAGYHTQGLIRIGRAYSENFLPLPYAVPIARDDDGGAFYNREIMLHGFPMSETSQGTFSPIGGGLASLGSTREESHGCIRLSYLGAKIVANASERFGYTTISLRK
jgi:hypothetical protein